MSSFVASLLAAVTGTLLLMLVRSDAELDDAIDVSVNDSTPIKLPKSVGDELISRSSGDATNKWHQSLVTLAAASQCKKSTALHRGSKLDRSH